MSNTEEEIRAAEATPVEKPDPTRITVIAFVDDSRREAIRGAVSKRYPQHVVEVQHGHAPHLVHVVASDPAVSAADIRQIVDDIA